MNQPTIKKISLGILVTMACGTLMAQGLKQAHGPMGAIVPFRPDQVEAGPPFYNNLAPSVSSCTGCNYDNLDGYYVTGPTNCLGFGTNWIAQTFVAGKTGPLTRIQLAVTADTTCTPAGAQFTVKVYDDICGGPNVVIATAKATAPATACGLATATFRNGPTLTLGNSYWVSVETVGAPQSAFQGVWWEAYNNLFAYNDGTGWLWPVWGGGPNLLAFQVL